MDNIFRNQIEAMVQQNGLQVLGTDDSIKSLIKKTTIRQSSNQNEVVYFDASDNVVCQAVVPRADSPPRFGKVEIKDVRKEYLAEYEKTTLKTIKIKCHKEKDADILQWAAQCNNIQAELKRLIREEIRRRGEGKHQTDN